MHTNISSKTTHNIKTSLIKNNVIHAHANSFMPWESNPSIVLQGNLTQVSTSTSRESNPSRHLMETNPWSRTSRESNPSKHLVSTSRESNPSKY
jgi:hypothetical protein